MLILMTNTVASRAQNKLKRAFSSNCGAGAMESAALVNSVEKQLASCATMCTFCGTVSKISYIGITNI